MADVAGKRLLRFWEQDVKKKDFSAQLAKAIIDHEN